MADESLTIPEYKFSLLNKNKKIIKKIENIEKIEKNSFNKDRIRKNFMHNKKIKILDQEISLKNIQEIKEIFLPIKKQ